MNDPLDTPPKDHGSDRHGYVELIGAPEGVNPPEAMIASLWCPDCLSNLFITYLGVSGVGGAHVWQPEIAHDETCPTFRAITGQQ